MLNILHIEDSYADALLTEEMIEKEFLNEKFNIKHSDSIKKSLEILKSGKDFDIILLDLSLSDGQGISNVKIINKNFPEIPIVVVTGIESDKTALEALNEGAQEYFVKSNSNPKSLKLAIYSALKNKSRENNALRNIVYDELTTLPSFRFLKEYIDLDIFKIKNSNKQLALMLVDIGNMNLINEKLGRDIGDNVIKHTGYLLQSIFGNSDFVSRYINDKFSVILNISTNENINELCITKVNELVNKTKTDDPLKGTGINYYINAGFAFFPLHGITSNSLIDEATTALNSAKAAGANKYHFPERTEIYI